MLDTEFDLKFNHFNSIQTTNRFKSVWSVYEVTNMFDLSGLSGETLRYGDHWGEGTVVIPLPGGILSWWDLWVAAEKAIEQSGDQHHMFIEHFRKKDNDIYLTTGS
jgi:hypothetical protein